jgi:hypothetical protein
MAAPHGPIEAPPMHRPEDRWDDDIETLAECIVRCVTDDLGYSIAPLVDDAVAIDGHGGTLATVSRAGSFHTWITVRARRRFTTRLVFAAVPGTPFPVGLARKKLSLIREPTNGPARA